jgi:hypothetical protein
MLKLQSRLGDWEFIRPGRELLKEGELQKISRKGVGPRYFVLLSDCLLYTSYYSCMLNRGKIFLFQAGTRNHNTESPVNNTGPSKQLSSTPT